MLVKHLTSVDLFHVFYTRSKCDDRFKINWTKLSCPEFWTEGER